MLNAGASAPTLERGQAIRGHYRAAGDELVIHARPCLVLLPVYLGLLPHVQHLRILGALHLWLSTSRWMSRTQARRGSAGLWRGYVCSIMQCKRHPQHATMPAPRALNRLCRVYVGTVRV